MEDDSILITEHRYTPCYDQTETSGKYCVQFMSFKNNSNGLTALNWWVNSCLEWCFNRVEDGKFGDQKYLDDWITRFDGVPVLFNLGGGVAPWNIQQYSVYSKDKQIYVKDYMQDTPIVFYHFHDIKINKNMLCKNTAYYKNKTVLNLIYKPYTKELIKSSNFLNQKYKYIEPIIEYTKPLSMILQEIRKKLIKFKVGRNGYLEILGRKII